MLVYETDPLDEDLTIAGPISPKMFVATSGTDSDFVVKLIDVYPNDYPNPEPPSNGKRILESAPTLMGGYEQLLRGEPMRAKFRNSWEKPEPMTPGSVEKLSFTMPDVNHTFRRGHRIMVQVQSSWFPLVDRNPQTFTDIPTAKPGDFRKATELAFRFFRVRALAFLNGFYRLVGRKPLRSIGGNGMLSEMYLRHRRKKAAAQNLHRWCLNIHRRTPPNGSARRLDSNVGQTNATHLSFSH